MAFARGRPLKKDPRLLGSTRHRVVGYQRGENLYISPLQRSGVTHVSMGKNPISVFGLQIPDVPGVLQDVALGGGGALLSGVLARVLVSKSEKSPVAFNVAHGVVGLVLGAAINQYAKSPGLKRFGQLTMAGSLAVAGYNLIDQYAGETVVGFLPESAQGLLNKFVYDKAEADSLAAAIKVSKSKSKSGTAATTATTSTATTPTTGLGTTMTLADARNRGLLGLGKTKTAEAAFRQAQAQGVSNRAGIGRSIPGSVDVRVAPSVAAAVQDAISGMSSRFTPSFMRS